MSILSESSPQSSGVIDERSRERTYWLQTEIYGLCLLKACSPFHCEI